MYTYIYIYTYIYVYIRICIWIPRMTDLDGDRISPRRCLEDLEVLGWMEVAGSILQ